jgi:hypothetical protein
MNRYIENPVFICGHRKGGTTVILCLFDNHPELLTFPIDSAFFYQAFPACESVSKEETIAAVIAKTFHENLVAEMQDVGDPEMIDINAICDDYAELARAEEHTAKNHLLAMIKAYAKHCGQDASRWKVWVEKTTSTEIYAQQIASWFPNARFIHIVRDPRDNWGSLLSGWQKRYQDQEDTPVHLLQSLIDRGGLGLRMARLNEASLGADRYKVVQFEELTESPESGLRNLCDFLNIDYSSTLEVPTVNGRPWKGNNFDGLKFSGLSAVNSGRWRERITENDAALIEAHLGSDMEGLGYKLAFDPVVQAQAAADHYKWFNSGGSKNVGR